MTTLPTWWLVLSGAFFAANLFLIFALAVVLIKVIPTLNKISARLESITTKVDSIADTSQKALQKLSERSDSVGGNIEVLASLAKGQAEKHLPLVMGVLSAFRILGAVREFRSQGKKSGGAPASKELPTKKRR